MVTTYPKEPKSIAIEEELRNSYMDYAMSVIVARALPSVQDGLKPVQRRVLYALHQLGLRPNTPYRKSARTVGEVLGRYHPHGEVSIYDAMVRLAQDFSMRYPLVDGQGNFGSIDDDPPAAMRYTEVRLAPIAMELLADIEKDTVDFALNFDASTQEPVLLPSRLPNLLINGSSGIAVGMATNIPPHNLSEVCSALVLLIDNPQASLEEIMALIPGPDFPGGGLILGDEGIKNAHREGLGRLLLQAKADIEEKTGNIIISELPYQTNKAALVQRIAQLAKDKKVDRITDIRDESNREGIRIVIELRRGTPAELVLNQLYHHTALRSTFAINTLALVDGQPRLLNLKELLEQHIEFRRQVLTRRSRFELQEAQQRAHILEGLKVALDNLDAIIQLIRASASAEAAQKALMDQFSLSTAQAQAILEMPLRRLAALERARILQDYEAVIKEIARLEDLLSNPKKILHLIGEEVSELKAKYGDPRRTQIIAAAAELSDDALIPSQNTVIALNQRYIKMLPYSSFSREVGLESRLICAANTKERLLFISKQGRLYHLKAYIIPAESSRSARGALLLNLLSPKPEEDWAYLLPVASFNPTQFLVLVTRQGKVKRTRLSLFAPSHRRGVLAMHVRGGDEVVSAQIAQEGNDIILISQQGKAIRFTLDTIRPQSRLGGGIRGMRLDPGDRIVASAIVDPDGHLLLITSLGYGKRLPFPILRHQDKAGKGIKVISLSSKNGLIVAATTAKSSHHRILLLSKQGQAFPHWVKDISVQKRNWRGVQVTKLNAEDELIGLAVMEREA